MLFILMGPSCTGKSTLAEDFRKERELEIFTGKEYLRLAKNENDAWKLFNERLTEYADSSYDKSAIYIITETSILSKLQIDKAVFVKFSADFEVIKERFSRRMKGNLPKPVEVMLEKQVKEWENVSCDICIDTTDADSQEIINQILELATYSC